VACLLAPLTPIPNRQTLTPLLQASVVIARLSTLRGFLIAEVFLAWLRSQCPKGISVQMKGERFVEVPKTADDFPAAITALRSLDVSKGVIFHIFSLPEDKCVRLLIKNLGRRMPETVVRKEFEALGTCVHGVLHLYSRLRDQDPEKDGPATPYFIVTMARGTDVSRVSAITQVCRLRITVQSYTAPRRPLQCRRCQRFGHTQRGSSYAPRGIAFAEAHLSHACSTPKQQLQCCSCGGNHTANYRGCGKWKEAKAALVRRAPAGLVAKSGAPSGGVQSATARPNHRLSR
jgi:hypothetical protein